jgi:hypothetical protein
MACVLKRRIEDRLSIIPENMSTNTDIVPYVGVRPDISDICIDISGNELGSIPSPSGYFLPTMTPQEQDDEELSQ